MYVHRPRIILYKVRANYLMFLIGNFHFVCVNNSNKVLSFAYPKISLYFNSFSLFKKIHLMFGAQRDTENI